MNLIQRLAAAFRTGGGVEQKAVNNDQKWLSTSMSLVRGQDGAKRPDFNYRNAVQLYRSWIYAAASLNAVAVASVPLRLYVRTDGAGEKLFRSRAVSRRQKAYLAGDARQAPSARVLRKAAEFGDEYEVVTESHPVLDLLNKVNPYMNGFDATVLRILWGELTGNAFFHPVIDRALGVPVELWPMPPQWTEIVPGKTEFIDGYLYGASREQRKAFAPDEVIHFKRPNPGDIYYGLGKLEAAWGAAMANVAMKEMDLSFFENKARPDYLLTVQGVSSEEELERFEAQIQEKLRGTRRSGHFLTSSAQIDVKPLAFPPKDLGGREDIVEEIAAVFGVPVSMLKANDPNLASATTGFAQWRETTVLPLLRFDEETLNQTLMPLFGIEGDAFLAYDNPVPSDKQFELTERQTSLAAGWRTVNEIREEIGLDRVEDMHADMLHFNGQPLGGVPQPTPFGASAPVAEPPATVDGLAGPLDDAEDDEPSLDAKAISSDCISDKIPKLIDEGYDRDQAIAIAYSMCAEGKSEDDAKAEFTRRVTTRKGLKAEVGEIDTVPPESVAENARRALDVRAEKPESQRGMTAVGIARARDLANRTALSEDTIRRMVAYFERHQSDKQGESWDEQGKGWQAWNGWGGDEGWSWAKRKVEEFDRARGKKSCGCGCGEKRTVSQKALWEHHTAPLGGIRTKASEKDAEKELEKVNAVEAAIKRAVGGVLDAQIVAVIAEMRKAGAVTPVVVRRIQTLIRSRSWNTEITEALAPMLKESLKTGVEVGLGAVKQAAAGMPDPPPNIEDLVSFSPARPELEKYVETESVRLAQQAATKVNEYTSVRVGELLGDGIQKGETVDELATRVQDWAAKNEDGARLSETRAVTVARTEAMRAMRSAEVEAWSATGLVEGKTWLLAPDPCEFCEAAAKAFGDKAIGLNDSFYQKGTVLVGTDGGSMTLDYEDVQGPPLHPNCRCSMQPKLPAELEAIVEDITDEELEAEGERLLMESERKR